jgi:putative ABC transport system permease protein
LTTSNGAQTLGLHNASYTEIFTRKPIDSSLIPPSAAMTVISYRELKHEQFIAKATQYGGMALLIVLMALLGFSAYFNGIIMKIQLKSYQISVLRAVGTDMKRIRRKLFIDNLKIPLLSGLISYIFMKLTQAISYGGYQKLLAFYNEIIEKKGGLVYGMLEDSVIKELKIRYFIEKLFWVVPLEIPLLIVLGFMCCLTLLLTILALKKSTKSAITSTLNQGRERL